MKPSERNKTDELKVYFFARDNPLDKGLEELDGFFEAIERHSGEFMPDRAALIKKKRPYSRENARRILLEEADEEFHLLDLVKQSLPEVRFWLKLVRHHAAARLQLRVTILPFACFQDNERAQARSRTLVSLVKALAERYPPTYGIGHGEADMFLFLGEELLPRAPERIDNICWLNILGKELVDAIGRERVLSTPAFQLEELKGGSVLLLTRPTPGDLDSEEARLAQARTLVHLRPDLQLDAVLATFGGRWVPRRNLDEAYVALGDRAFLPFLRARHYLQSEQSVLDYSMSQFFREAERHVRGHG